MAPHEQYNPRNTLPLPPMHDSQLLPEDLYGIEEMDLLRSWLKATLRCRGPEEFDKAVKSWSDDKQAVVAIVPSSGMCSLKQLAKATGLKKVEMMKPAEAEKLTGYKVGGISPLAQKKLLPTVLDDSAMAFDEILVSGGKRGLSVGVAPGDMVRLMNWIAAPIGDHHD